MFDVDFFPLSCFRRFNTIYIDTWINKSNDASKLQMQIKMIKCNSAVKIECDIVPFRSGFL